MARLVARLCWLLAAAILCGCAAWCAAQPPPLPFPAAAQSAASSSLSSSAALPPFQLSEADRGAVLVAAARSGYSDSEALAIVQSAYYQHIPLTSLTAQPTEAASAAATAALLSSSSTCPPIDAQCSFARACAQCYSDQSGPRCLPCLALLECNGQPDCQLKHACRVCSNIDSSAADRPHACSQLAAHC